MADINVARKFYGNRSIAANAKSKSISGKPHGKQRSVRQHGLEIFMKEQREKYTCLKCGGIISIHDGECSECQEEE